MKYNLPFNIEYQKIIEQFIIDKVTDAKAVGVVLGLSGGLDSSVVLKICSNEYSGDKIIPIFMPESTTPDLDTEHAHLLAKELGISLLEIPMNKIISEYLAITDIPKPNPMALGNLKARVRMNILYLVANSMNHLVVGTSNKTELFLGYFTKYGDGASDIAPIGDLYKTQVRELAKHLKLPDEIITKPPTAGLVSDQTDEDDLGLDYGIIDKILYALERSAEPEKIAKDLGLDLFIVLELKTRMEINRHKRKFPKIPKIGIKTIGVDLYEQMVLE
jgi:NAD+ synthase